MKRNTIITLSIIVAIVLIFALSTMGSYNGMVTQKETVSAQLRNIDAQLQRRVDLIPNLVNTVKGFAAQEKSIMADVTANRAKLAGATTVPDKANANDQLTSSLSRLLVIAENYPQLKSDANFRQLSDELAGTENRIAVSRLDYNNAVQTYNTTIKSFPTAITAGIFGFKEAEYFKATSNASVVPSVSFAQ
jgi:LemA protein